MEDGLGDQEADTARPVVSRSRVNVLAVTRSYGADIVSVVVVFPGGRRGGGGIAPCRFSTCVDLYE